MAVKREIREKRNKGWCSQDRGVHVEVGFAEELQVDAIMSADRRLSSEYMDIEQGGDLSLVRCRGEKAMGSAIVGHDASLFDVCPS